MPLKVSSNKNHIKMKIMYFVLQTIIANDEIAHCVNTTTISALPKQRLLCCFDAHFQMSFHFAFDALSWWHFFLTELLFWTFSLTHVCVCVCFHARSFRNIARRSSKLFTHSDHFYYFDDRFFLLVASNIMSWIINSTVYTTLVLVSWRYSTNGKCKLLIVILILF